MKKLTVIFLIIILVFASVPAFAKTWKIEKPEDSFFNVMRDYIASFAKVSDGTSVLKVKNKPSWLSSDEIKKRRRSEVGGVVRGMNKYDR